MKDNQAYYLEVIIPKKDKKLVPLLFDLSFGSDSSCDLPIRDNGLAPLQGRIRVQNDILTFTNLGKEDSIKLGSQKCGQGRMYIIDNGDKLTLGKVKLVIKQGDESFVKGLTTSQEASYESGILRDEEAEISEDEWEEETDKIQAPNRSFKVRISSFFSRFKKSPQKNDKENPKETSGLKEGVQDIEEEDDEEYEFIEEVVYVDEDGNEVAMPEKTSFLDVFKGKYKKRPKQPPKRPMGNKGHLKLKGRKAFIPAAGLPYRILAQSYNFLFCYLLLTIGLDLIAEFSGYDVRVLIGPTSEELFKVLTPWLNKIPAALPKTLPQINEFLPVEKQKEIYKFLREAILDYKNFKIFFFYFLYDSLFHILFGVSLGALVLGFSNKGNILLSRLFGPVRSLLALITPPFIIFDLPTLFRRRSFKEILTFSRYEVFSPKLAFIQSFVTIPVVTLLLFNFRFILLFKEAPKNYEMKAVKANPLQRQEGIVDFLVSDEKNNLYGQVFSKTNHYFVPELSHENNKWNTSLTIGQFQGDQSAVLTFNTHTISREQIQKILRIDPVFEKFNPEAFQYLKHFNSDGKEDMGRKTPLEIKALEKKFMELVFKALSIAPMEFLESYKTFGPFLNPYVQLKKEIFKILKTERFSSIEKIEAKYADMIVFSTTGAMAGFYVARPHMGGIHFSEISFDSKNKTIAGQFLKDFFYSTQTVPLTEEQNSKIGFNKEAKAYSDAYKVFQLFEAIVKEKTITSDEAFTITSFFTKLSGKLLKEDAKMAQVIMLGLFEKLDKALLRLTKGQNSQLKDLRLGLLRIQSALDKKDEKFFILNAN